MSRRGTLKRNALAAREVIMVVHEQMGQRVGSRPYTVGEHGGADGGEPEDYPFPSWASEDEKAAEERSICN
ncbi:hypothetical protein NC652_018430 [Populus alba x Populus x berolinensis]|nr:hypothetical protein NC652_018430 [Populus alba x Populus x berolinensis]